MDGPIDQVLTKIEADKDLPRLVNDCPSCTDGVMLTDVSRRSAKNGEQNGGKNGHFQCNSLGGSDGPSDSVGTSNLG